MKEALKLALEAFEGFYDYGYDRLKCFEHITAIKEALAQPEPEYVLPGGGCVPPILLAQPEQEPVETLSEHYLLSELKSALTQPEQEPVGTVKELLTKSAWEKLDLRGSTKLYTAPPKRQPLTVDEVWQSDQLMSLNAQLGCGMDLLMEVVEAVEAAHGIKETT